MNSKKSVLLIIDSKLSRAPRAQTMIRALKNDYNVTVAAIERDGENGYEFEPLKLGVDKRKNFHFNYPWLLRKLVSAYFFFTERITKLLPSYYYENKIWNQTNRLRVQQFKNRKFDLVIGHHAHNLPVAATIAKKMNARLFFNAHEYYPKEFDDNEEWVKNHQPFVTYICKKYLKNVKECFCASPGYAEAFQDNFNLSCTVIPCVKPYYPLRPTEVKNKVRIVHQGYANPDRKIETMIQMCDHLKDRFELHLYLLATDNSYFSNIKKMVEERNNVFLLPPVSPEKLVETLNSYDIGIYILEPTNFNTKFMLPNKTFEFVQGRIMTAISPALGMVPYVNKYNLGIVASDHLAKSMADSLNALSNDEIMKFKENTDKAAVPLAAESYYPIIQSTIAKYLN